MPVQEALYWQWASVATHALYTVQAILALFCHQSAWSERNGNLANISVGLSTISVAFEIAHVHSPWVSSSSNGSSSSSSKNSSNLLYLALPLVVRSLLLFATIPRYTKIRKTMAVADHMYMIITWLIVISALSTVLAALHMIFIVSGNSLNQITDHGIALTHITFAVLFACNNHRQSTGTKDHKGRESADQRRYCPEESEPIFSKLTYQWVYGFLTTTSTTKTALRQKRVPLALPKHLQPTNTLAEFNKNFERSPMETDLQRRRLLARVVLETFKWDLLLSSGLRLFVYFNEIAIPLTVAKLLHELGGSSNNSDQPPTDESKYKIIISLATYSILSIVATLVEQNQVDIKDKTILKIRLTLTASIHQSLLKIPNLSELAQLDGVDLYSCGTQFAHHLAHHLTKLTESIWLPLRVIAGLYIFYQQVGWAVLPGICVILIYLPLRKLLLRKITMFHKLVTSASSQRVQLLTQLFDNIISIKLLGWEDLLIDKISELRKGDELSYTLKSKIYACLLSVTCIACRSGGPLISLFIYSMVFNHSGSLVITAKQVYIVQAILRELFPLLIDIPHAFDSWWAAKQPYTNINNILVATKSYSNKSTNDAEPTDDEDSAAVRIVDGEFTWIYKEVKEEKKEGEGEGEGEEEEKFSSSSSSNGFVLRNVNLDCKHGQLIAILGKVGTGKSSLLSAILGEMKQQQGHKYIPPNKKIAYVSQQSPWLMNDTIQSNILFGQEYDEEWYQMVVGLCELKHDLDRFIPLGDQTVIGNNGITLSGGQKVRIALARAIYSRADIYLFDDVLASVDANVGHRLFANIISSSTGILRDRCRLVVTKEANVVDSADLIYLISSNGFVELVGSHQKDSIRSLVENSMDLRQLALDSTLLSTTHSTDPSSPSPSSSPSAAAPALLATPPTSSRSITVGSPVPQQSEKDKKPASKPKSGQADKSPAKPAENTLQYMPTIKYMLHLCGAFIVIAHILTVAAQSLASRQAQLWLGKPIPLVAGEHKQQEDKLSWIPALNKWTNPTLSHFVVCLIWWTTDIMLEFGSQWWTEVSWKKAIFTKSHSEILESITKAPISFFSSSTMPTGAILSIFTDNQKDIDTVLPQRISNVTTYGVKLLFETWVILMFHPLLVITMVAIVWMMKKMVDISQEPLEQYINLQNETNPKIHEQFQQSLDGSIIIRAFRNYSYIEGLMFDRLGDYARAQRSEDSIETWIDLTMSLMRNFVTSIAFSIAAGSYLLKGQAIDSTYLSIVHMCTTFHLSRLQHLTRKAHEMRSGFIRAQKFIKYTKLANDSNKKTPNGSAPSTTTAATTTNIASGSPNAGSGSGQIVFDHVFARYSSDSQLALGDMSFAINPGQHVGIVGRTGSGKTSIVMALFGLLQSERGSITIDSIDISSLDAQTLRAKLSIVPQTPTMLLPGTIRDNLDPLNKCTNEDIKQALAKVGLEQQVDIDMPVTSSTRWSIGELQLLCLARALLRRTNILVLDEATAAIDGLTSRNLHRVIQQEFASCTVITIAHRVESVLHNDLVMVVEDGRICEAGRPADLCSIPNGYFATLVKRSMGTCDVIDGEKTEAMEPATCPPTPP